MRTLSFIAPSGVPTRQPVHPGRFLERHFLHPMALSQTKAARLLGVSRRRLNELIQGHRAMSADTAIRCAMAFGVRADFWLALQAHWDCFHAWRTLRQSRLTGRALVGPTTHARLTF
jgi:addiction module HigA family antidote